MNTGNEGRGLLPLGLLARGDSAEVVHAAPGGEHGRGQGIQAGLMRVEDMGLRAGTLVEVLANEGHGPLLLKVGAARIAIGRGIAMKIQVRPGADERSGGGWRS